ncbi:ph-response sensor protein, partial [Cryomyces antarcticus]
MLSTSPRASSTSQLPSSGRRLISKITSPFAPKVRNVTDFYIQPSDPHRQYAPGDIVSGSVVLKVVKPVRVTHIVVCLHGFVQVYKNPNSPGDGVRGNNAYPGLGRGNRSGEYFGNGFASLFEDEVVLCGEGRLSEGLYHFKFDLEFPGRGLPSSIDFERGTISYMVTATMTRPTTISPTITCDRKVFLVENIDIAALRPPKPRTISLEPISRRSRLNKTELSAAMIMRTNRLSEPGSVQSENEVPQSPSPSAVSVDSL